MERIHQNFRPLFVTPAVTQENVGHMKAPRLVMIVHEGKSRDSARFFRSLTFSVLSAGWQSKCRNAVRGFTMYKALLITAILSIAALPGHAQMFQRKASLVGVGVPNGGKCTVQVVVDGAADVELRGDNANLSNVSGQAPMWQRFDCTGVMPYSPASVRFVPTEGRGSQELVRDPRNGGTAVVHIEDPEGGPGVYAFDIVWSYRTDQYQGRYSAEQAMRICRDEVRDRAARNIGRDIEFQGTDIDSNGLNQNRVFGRFDAPQSGDRYEFSCSMTADGRLRSVDIEPLRPIYGGEEERSRSEFSGQEAIQVCRDSAAQRVERQGYHDLMFRSTNLGEPGGRTHLVNGVVQGYREGYGDSFDFSCRVNRFTGNVQSIEVSPR
jgi:hypothetical protein